MASSLMGLSLNGDRSLDKLDKLCPSGAAAVELHAVEPELGVVKQLQCCERHLLVVRCPVHIEDLLAAIQPRQGVASAAKLRELHLVSSGVVVVAGIPYLIVPSTSLGASRWVRATRRTLRHLDPVDSVLQFLLLAILVGHYSL
jgi:hypothetical protein